MKFLKGLLFVIYFIICISVIFISITYLVLDFDKLLNFESSEEWKTINILLLFLPIIYLFLIKILGWIPLLVSNIIMFILSLFCIKRENKFVKYTSRIILLISIIISILLIICYKKIDSEYNISTKINYLININN